MVRGIDHARVLARAFSEVTRIPLRQPIRQFGGVMQATLTASQRARRRSGFGRRWIRRSLRGRTVILVDDVLTSGKTARSAAIELQRLGAAEVILVVVAVADGSGSSRTNAHSDT